MSGRDADADAEAEKALEVGRESSHEKLKRAYDQATPEQQRTIRELLDEAAGAFATASEDELAARRKMQIDVMKQAQATVRKRVNRLGQIVFGAISFVLIGAYIWPAIVWISSGSFQWWYLGVWVAATVLGVLNGQMKQGWFSR